MSEWEARSPHDYMPSRVPRWLLRLLDHLMPSVSLAKSDRWRSFIVISIVLIGEQLIMLAFMLVSFVLNLNLVAPIEFLLIAISILVICALLLLNKYGHGELAIRLMMGAVAIMAAIQVEALRTALTSDRRSHRFRRRFGSSTVPGAAINVDSV